MDNVSKSINEYFQILNTEEKVDLKDYGLLFQHKLIYTLIIDRPYLEQLFEILNPSVFENDGLQWLVKNIKKHFIDYNELISTDVIKTLIKTTVNNDNLKNSIVQELKQIYKSKDTNNFDFVKKEAVEFFKFENMQKVLVTSFEDLDKKDYTKIKKNIDDALTAGEDKRAGLDYTTEIEERYNQSARNPIPTGYEILDNELDGGLSYGELGVILGPSSAGKSWVLIHFATRAMLSGKNVVYYTLEDEEGFHAKRVDSILTGISTSDLKFHRDKIEQAVKNLKGTILFKHYPQNVTNALSIASHLNRLKLLGKFPDIIFLDYGDIMSPIEKFQSDWLNQKQIFNEIKSMAQMQHLPIWTAAQAGRASKEKDIVDDTDMAQAYAKVAPSNIILSISRKIEDKVEGTGRLFIAKNKYGRDAVTFPFDVDHSKGKFEIYSMETEEGKEIGERLKRGDATIKNRMKEKLEQLKNRNQ